MSIPIQQINIANSVGSSTRPPLLSIDEYGQWKIRMEMYLSGIDPDVWRSIRTGPHVAVPTQQAEDADEAQEAFGGFAPDGLYYTALDLQKMTNDRRAARELTTAIPPELFRFIESCTNAKEMWDTLATMFEGDADSKQCKRLNSLSEFDNFKVLPGESLKAAFNRYNVLITDLYNTGHRKDNMEINLKFLNSLGSAWKMVRVVMRSHKDLATSSIYNLFRLLQSHEAGVIQDMNEDSQLGGPLALISTVHSNTFVPQEAITMNETGTEEEDEDDMNEAMHALALYGGPNNRFQKYVRKPGQQNGPSPSNNQTANYYGNNKFKSSTPKYANTQKYNPKSSGPSSSPPKYSQKPSNFVSKPSESSEGSKDVRCHKCGKPNHFAKDCKLQGDLVKDWVYYANKSKFMQEEANKKEKPGDQAFVVRRKTRVEVWSTGDEKSDESDDEPVKVFGFRGQNPKNPCFMAMTSRATSSSEATTSGTEKPVIPSYQHMRTNSTGGISVVEQVQSFLNSQKLSKDLCEPLIKSITDKMSTALSLYNTAIQERHNSLVEQAELKRRLNSAVCSRESLKDQLVREHDARVLDRREYDKLSNENVILKNDVLVMKRKFDTIYNCKLQFQKLRNYTENSCVPFTAKTHRSWTYLYPQSEEGEFNPVYCDIGEADTHYPQFSHNFTDFSTIVNLPKDQVSVRDNYKLRDNTLPLYTRVPPPSLHKTHEDAHPTPVYDSKTKTSSEERFPIKTFVPVGFQVSIDPEEPLEVNCSSEGFVNPEAKSSPSSDSSNPKDEASLHEGTSNSDEKSVSKDESVEPETTSTDHQNDSVVKVGDGQTDSDETLQSTSQVAPTVFKPEQIPPDVTNCEPVVTQVPPEYWENRKIEKMISYDSDESLDDEIIIECNGSNLAESVRSGPLKISSSKSKPSSEIANKNQDKDKTVTNPSSKARKRLVKKIHKQDQTNSKFERGECSNQNRSTPEIFFRPPRKPQGFGNNYRHSYGEKRTVTYSSAKANALARFKEQLSSRMPYRNTTPRSRTRTPPTRIPPRASPSNPSSPTSRSSLKSSEESPRIVTILKRPSNTSKSVCSSVVTTPCQSPRTSQDNVTFEMLKSQISNPHKTNVSKVPPSGLKYRYWVNERTMTFGYYVVSSHPKPAQKVSSKGKPSSAPKKPNQKRKSRKKLSSNDGAKLVWVPKLTV